MFHDLDQLDAFLLEQQFRKSKVETHGMFVMQPYYRRIDDERLTTPCLSNDRNSLSIRVYSGEMPDGSFYLSSEATLSGEARADVWVDFKLYCLTTEQVLTRLPELEQMLIDAWNAVVLPNPTDDAETAL